MANEFEEQETIADIEAAIKTKAINEGIFEVKQFGTTLDWTRDRAHAESRFSYIQNTVQLWQIRGQFRNLLKERINGKYYSYE